VVPISVLLQVVALTIGDETELRRVQSEDVVDLETESRPLAAFALTYPKFNFGAGYSPTFFAGPLESDQRRTEILHSVFADAGMSFGSARQTLSLTLSGAGEQRNPRREALSTLRGTDSTTGTPGTGTPGGSTTPGGTGTPGTGGSGTAATGSGSLVGSDTIVIGTVRTVRARGAARFRRVLTRTAGLAFEAGYEVSGGVDDASEDSYPLMHGPNAAIVLDKSLSRRNTLASSLTGNLSKSERNRAWLVNASEVLNHAFTRSTSGSIGAGVAYVRNEPANGPTEDGFTPTASAALTSVAPLAKGELASQINMDYVPVLDPQTTELDPRVRTVLGLVWTRRSFSLSLRSESDLSGNPGGSNEIQALRAEGVLGYDLGSGFTTSAGARAAWQRAAGVETLPPSSVLFIALSWFTTVEDK
jgi:hypothetical protein